MEPITREIVFIAPNLKMGSARLRAAQISDELNRRNIASRVAPSAEGLRNCLLIFIKGDSLERIVEAKESNNVVVVDVIDCHQKTFHQSSTCNSNKIQWLHISEVESSLFDGLIFVNSYIAKEMEDYCVDLETSMIFHPWDERFGEIGEFQGFSLVSLGHSSDRIEHPGLLNLTLDNHVLDNELVNKVKMYSCHLSVRMNDYSSSNEQFGNRSKAFFAKSNIKISTAAACGANIISSKDPGSTDLLPADYPFWYDHTCELSSHIDLVDQSYGGPEWKAGLEMMIAARERTSTARVVDEYVEFLQRF